MEPAYTGPSTPYAILGFVSVRAVIVELETVAAFRVLQSVLCDVWCRYINISAREYGCSRQLLLIVLNMLIDDSHVSA